MPEQADEAPPDARDPHAESGGYTRHSGPYLVDGAHALHHGDGHPTGAWIIERLEWVNSDPEPLAAYEMKAWYGNSYRRLWLDSEGDYAGGGFEETETELLFGQAISPYWDALLGVRYDTLPGTNRSWLALGIQGLAPWWFEVDATAYIGESGHPAFKLEAEYELLFTQRLVLQPRLEVSLFGRDDPVNDIGSGASEGSLGLRLRYEFSRQFAPYLGVEWARTFGQTADYAREEGSPTSEIRFLAGIRAWF
jgi:copper resistance protein B